MLVWNVICDKSAPGGHVSLHVSLHVSAPQRHAAVALEHLERYGSLAILSRRSRGRRSKNTNVCRVEARRRPDGPERHVQGRFCGASGPAARLFDNSGRLTYRDYISVLTGSIPPLGPDWRRSSPSSVSAQAKHTSDPDLSGNPSQTRTRSSCLQRTHTNWLHRADVDACHEATFTDLKGADFTQAGAV